MIVKVKEREKLMREIQEEVTALKESPLYEYRVENDYLPVIGEGSLNAKIMFVGEAPGRNEAKTGKPFCGAAGKILDQLLESVGIERKNVYITSIVKDRPPKNRDPLPREIEIYGPFLDRQIEIIQPQVIAALGRYACEYIISKFGLASELEPIGKLHGKVFDAKLSFGPIKVVALYHPAVAIYNSNTKDQLKQDFQVLKTL
jgi:uracil-DNA glycosylase